MAREPAKDMAGVLFAAPAGGERWGGFEPHARVAGGELRDDPRGAVSGMIVEDDDFKCRTAIAQDCFQRRADVLLLVAGGDENGNWLGVSLLLIRERSIDGQV